jgi:DNA-binding LytR/AlgR family response regulator
MKIVIIEDEMLTAEDLKETILNHLPTAQIEAIIPSVKKALEYFSTSPKVDLIFSDIQLQDGASFDIYRQIHVSAPIIFCTAFNEYALDAIKSNGIDYVLKPFSQEEISKAIDKYLALRNNMVSSNVNPAINIENLISSLGSASKKSSILVYYKDKILPIRIEDIVIFYKQNEITYLKTVAGKAYSIDQTMDQLEETIGKNFFRINRQCLVNHKSIRETTNLFNRKLQITLEVPLDFEVEVSRNRVSDFLEWLTA